MEGLDDVHYRGQRIDWDPFGHHDGCFMIDFILNDEAQRLVFPFCVDGSRCEQSLFLRDEHNHWPSVLINLAIGRLLVVQSPGCFKHNLSAATYIMYWDCLNVVYQTQSLLRFN
jgi:hypothetical protein